VTPWELEPIPRCSMAESDAFRGESILHRPRGRIRDPSSYLDIPCDQAYNLGSSQPGLE